MPKKSLDLTTEIRETEEYLRLITKEHTKETNWYERQYAATKEKIKELKDKARGEKRK